MAGNVFGYGPGAAIPTTKPGDRKAAIDRLAIDTQIPANVLMAFEEAGEPAEAAATRLGAEIKAGKRVEDVVPRETMNRAWDIADAMYPAPKAEPAAPKEENGVVTDLALQAGGALTRGVGAMGSAIGTMADIYTDGGVKLNPKASAVGDAARAGGSVISGWGDYIASGVSETGKEAMEGSMPDGELFDPSTWKFGDKPSLRGYAMLASDVMGSLLPVVATAVITKNPAAAGAVGGAMGGGSAAETARDTIAEMAVTPHQDGGTVLEHESKYYRSMIESGIAPEEALRRTSDAAEKLSFILTAPVSTFGGVATGAIFGKGVSALASKGLGPRIAGTAALSGLEEGAQEAAETIATRQGINSGAGTDLSLTEGTFGDFILGALGGSGPGAVSGAFEKAGDDGSVPGPAAAPGAGVSDPVAPGAGPAVPNPLAPRGPISGIAAAAPDLTPIPEPEPAPLKLPDFKPGKAVRLADPETGVIHDAVFVAETPTGGAIIRVQGQEIEVDAATLDSARIAAQRADEKAAGKKPVATKVKVETPKSAPVDPVQPIDTAAADALKEQGFYDGAWNDQNMPKPGKLSAQATPKTPAPTRAKETLDDLTPAEAAKRAKILEDRAAAGGWTKPMRDKHQKLTALAGGVDGTKTIKAADGQRPVGGEMAAAKQAVDAAGSGRAQDLVGSAKQPAASQPLSSTREAASAADDPGKPSGPLKAPSSTGLVEMGSGMAKAISEGYVDMLFDRHHKGDTKDASGSESPALRLAKRIKDAGGEVGRANMRDIAIEADRIMALAPEKRIEAAAAFVKKNVRVQPDLLGGRDTTEAETARKEKTRKEWGRFLAIAEGGTSSDDSSLDGREVLIRRNTVIIRAEAGKSGDADMKIDTEGMDRYQIAAAVRGAMNELDRRSPVPTSSQTEASEAGTPAAPVRGSEVAGESLDENGNLETDIVELKDGRDRLVRLNLQRRADGWHYTSSHDIPGLAGGMDGSRDGQAFATKQAAIADAKAKIGRMIMDIAKDTTSKFYPAAKVKQAQKIAKWAGIDVAEAAKAPVATKSEKPAVSSTGLLSVLSQDKQDRAADLKKRLADKMRNQVSSGLDPEYITLGGELVALYIEAGAKRFGQMLADFAETTGLTLKQAQEPLRAAYNHVRDNMELAGESIDGMDDAKAVLEESRRAIQTVQEAGAEIAEAVAPPRAKEPREPVARGADRPTGKTYRLENALTPADRRLIGASRQAYVGEVFAELDNAARRANADLASRDLDIDQFDELGNKDGNTDQMAWFIREAEAHAKDLVKQVKAEGAENVGPLSKDEDTGEWESDGSALANALDFLDQQYAMGLGVDEDVTPGPNTGLDGDITPMDPEKVFPAPAKGGTRNIDAIANREGFIDMDEAEARLAFWKKTATDIGSTTKNQDKVILSLFDYKGTWSQPWRDAGYTVIQHDIKTGSDLLRDAWIYGRIAEIRADGKEVHGVLSACPCTTFTGSGARWWEERHDVESPAALAQVFGDAAVSSGAKSALEYNIMLVQATRDAVKLANPTAFHVLENPVGRIQDKAKMPNPLARFHPHNFGDPYTKRTQLFGDFKADLPTANVDPVEGSKMQNKLRGSDPLGKEDRSTTPEGFAYAFFMANDPDARLVKEGAPAAPQNASVSPSSKGKDGQEPADITMTPAPTPEAAPWWDTADDLTRRAILQEAGMTATGSVSRGFESLSQGLRAELTDAFGRLYRAKKIENIGTIEAPRYALTGVTIDAVAVSPSSLTAAIWDAMPGAGSQREALAVKAGLGGRAAVLRVSRTKWDELSDIARERLTAAYAQGEKPLPPVPAPTAAAAPTSEEITAAAAEADPTPTDGQKDAGNYKMGHIAWNGIDISIENAKGSERAGFAGKMPDVPAGHVRMFRGEATTVAALPEWIEQGLAASGAKDAQGRWFTPSMAIAMWYVRDAGATGALRYVDVPRAVYQASRVTDNAEAKQFSRDPENENFLPREYADKAQPTPGVAWSVVMPAHYGYIKRTTGKDGDHVDVYIGEAADSDVVVVFDQVDPKTGKFDEHKVILNAKSIKDATAIYDGGFSDGSGPTRRKAPKALNVEEFKAWLANGDLTKPIHKVTDADFVAWGDVDKRKARDEAFDAKIKAWAETLPKDEADADAKAAKAGFTKIGRNARNAPVYEQIVTNDLGDKVSWRATWESTGFITEKGWEKTVGTFGPDGARPRDAMFDVVPPQAKAPVLQLEAPEAEAPVDDDTEQEGPKRKPKVNDFGELIGGQRKNTAKKYITDLMDGRNIESMSTSEAFPQPDYEALAANGVEAKALAYVAVLRGRLERKPTKSWRVPQWALSVENARKLSAKLLTGEITPADIETKFSDGKGYGMDFAGMRLYDKHVWTAKVIAELDPSMMGAAGAGFEVWGGRLPNTPQDATPVYAMTKINAYVSGWDLQQSGAYASELNDEGLKKLAFWLEARIETGKKKKRENEGGETPINLTVRTYRYGGYGIFTDSPKLLSVSPKFDTVTAARKYLDDNRAMIEAKVRRLREGPAERRDENNPRVGNEWRVGDATEAMFLNDLGFRGVAFGASLTAAERQERMNSTYDAFMDLAGVLNVPVKMLSLDGRLGLGFGTHGKGGKGHWAAVYMQSGDKSVDQVIALTRKHGAGTLAHEWWHAVDNFFARKDAKGSKTSAGMSGDKADRRNDFMSDREGSDGALSDDVRGSFRQLRRSLESSEWKRRMDRVDSFKGKPYYGTIIELAARGFERMVVDELYKRDLSNDFLANINEVSGAYLGTREFRKTGIERAFLGVMESIKAELDVEGKNGPKLPAILEDRVDRDAKVGDTWEGPDGWREITSYDPDDSAFTITDKATGKKTRVLVQSIDNVIAADAYGLTEEGKAERAELEAVDAAKAAGAQMEAEQAAKLAADKAKHDEENKDVLDVVKAAKLQTDAILTAYAKASGKSMNVIKERLSKIYRFSAPAGVMNRAGRIIYGVMSGEKILTDKDGAMRLESPTTGAYHGQETYTTFGLQFAKWYEATWAREQAAKPKLEPEPEAKPDAEPDDFTDMIGDLIDEEMGDASPASDEGKITAEFLKAFTAGDSFRTIVQARKRAGEAIGRSVEVAEHTMVEEAIELAVVKRAREIVAAGTDPEAIYADLMSLYDSQPILGERVPDKIRFQAYSTPAPLAYLASRLAGIGPKTRVVEPTAGNGMLLIGANPDLVQANELQPHRSDQLRDGLGPDATVTTKDAMDATFAPFDVVITNPPFGKVTDDITQERKEWPLGKTTTKEIDHAIAWNVLGQMPEDGRAVLIIGGVKKQLSGEERKRAYQERAKSVFFSQLYDAYNVVDHFTVAGELYTRQGAAWPVDVIVIDGKSKSSRDYPMKTVPEVLSTWAEIGRKLSDAPDVDTEGRGPDSGDGLPERSGAADKGAVSGPAGGQDQQPDGGDTGSAEGQPPANGGPGAVVSGGNGTAGGRKSSGGGKRTPGVGNSEPGDVADPGDGVQTGRPGSGERGPGGLPGPSVSNGVNPDRTAGDAIKSAISNAAKGGAAALDGLNELFGGKNTLNSGLTFSEETYKKAKPLFIAAVRAFGTAGEDIKDAIRAVIRAFMARGYNKAQVTEMAPYLNQFAKDVTSGEIDPFADPAPEKKPDAKKRENSEQESEFQIQYQPRSASRYAVGTLVPRQMQDAMDTALQKIQDEHGDIDDYVARELGYTREELLGTDGNYKTSFSALTAIASDPLPKNKEKEKDGYFSAEQVDALAMAIKNVSQGKGFINGDQTGVGKGRFVAAMLRYGARKGKIPVFVTQKPGLYADMVRDLRDIGMADVQDKIIATNGSLQSVPISGDDDMFVGAKKSELDKLNAALFGGKMPDGKSYVFTTYDQITTTGGKWPTRAQAIMAAASNVMLVLDESHTAGGSSAGGRDGPRKPGDPPTNRAEFFRDMVAKSAGSVFASATYAKNPAVMSLYSATDLSLAVGDIEKLGPAIEAGGVPLQQVTATMLTEAGQYVRRERSFAGVEFGPQEMVTNREHAVIVSKAIGDMALFDKETMQAVREEAQSSYAEGGFIRVGDTSVGTAGASSANFGSTVHNLVNQFLLAVKLDASIDLAISAWKAGEKPVITLMNVNTSIIADYIRDAELKVGDKVNIPFSTIMERYLERLRYITVKTVDEEKIYIRLTDEQIGPAAVSEMAELKEMILNLPLQNLSGSPVDVILDRLRAAGMKVDEITGRNTTLEGGVVSSRVNNSAENKRRMNAYNSGKLDALILSASGSTGFSLHATDKKGNDGKTRHMIVLQPHADINVFMQTLGRVHRTGQIKLPKYSLAFSDLAIEKRVAAVLMKKMASLNANTTAGKKGTTTLEGVDFVNEVGDKVMLRYLQQDPHLAMKLDLHNRTEGKNPNSVDLARIATGRFIYLHPDEVDAHYEAIELAYDAEIRVLEAAGTSPLEAKTLNMAAETISRTVVREGSGSDSPFGVDLVSEQVWAKRDGVPYKRDKLEELIEKSLDGKTKPEWFNAISAELDAKMPAHLEQLRELVGERTTTYSAAELVRDKAATVEDAARAAIRELYNDPDRKPEDVKKAEGVVTEARRELQKARTALETAREGVAGARRRIETEQTKLENIKDSLRALVPGATYTVKLGDDLMSAVVLDVDLSKQGSNPTAASRIRVRFALADATREQTWPLSQIMDQDADSTQFDVVMDREEVFQAFDTGQTSRREQRTIITGNLIAGVDMFKKSKGQVVYYTTDTGETKPGYLMPRSFDLKAAMSEQNVIFDTVENAEKFIRQNQAILKTTDDLLSIQQDGYNFKVAIQKGGGRGRPYFLLQAVSGLIGDFREQGKNYVGRVRSGDLRAVLQAYATNLGVTYNTAAFKDEARAIMGISLPSATQMNDGIDAAEMREDPLAPIIYEDKPVDDYALRVMTKDLNADLEAHGLTGKVTVRAVRRVMLASGAMLDSMGVYQDGGIQVRSGSKAGVVGILRHEIIHALRDANLWGKSHGLFMAREWEALERAAYADLAIRDSVLERYGPGPGPNGERADGFVPLDEDALLEEMVAELYRLWAAGRDENGIAGRALERVAQFFEAMASLLRGRGYISAGAIMEQIANGTIGSAGPTPFGGIGGGALRTGVSEMREDGGVRIDRDNPGGEWLARNQEKAVARVAPESNVKESRAGDILPPATRRKFGQLLGSAHWKDPKGFASGAVTDAMAGKNGYNVLALVPGRALFAELGKTIMSAKTYLRAKEEMDALRNGWHAKADEVAQVWRKARNKDPRANDDLMDLMHRSTRSGVDPSKPDTWKHAMGAAAEREVSKRGDKADKWAHAVLDQIDKHNTSYAVLKVRYDVLPAEMQAIYRDVRAQYDRLGDEFEKAVLENIETGMKVAIKRAQKAFRKEMDRIRDEGLRGDEKAEAIDKAQNTLDLVKSRGGWGAKAKIAGLRKQFESNRLKGPYFPLARFGQYFVTVRNQQGEVVSFSRFEKETQQKTFIREQEEAGAVSVKFGVISDAGSLRGQVDPTFVADVEGMLADSGASETVMDAIWQRWLETLPDTSIRTSKIHRKGREGWNTDASRAFGSHMFHGAHQLARLKYGLEMEEALNDAEDEAKVASDPNRAGLVVNEMRRRHDFTMNPQGSSIVAGISSLAFVWYLGATPAAALANISQTTVMGPGIMAARFKTAGITGSLREIGRAMADFTKGRGNIQKAPGITQDEHAALTEAYRRGSIDRTQAHDLASVAETGIEYNATRENVMRKIGFFFHHAERMNREVTFLANYRLARAEGLRGDDAIDAAADMTWKIHFDYQNCVDDQTEILTIRGWKTWDHLGAGDRIISTDDAGKAVEIGVQEVNVFHRPQEIALFEARGSRRFSMAVTDDHKCVAMKQSKAGGKRGFTAPHFVEAKALDQRHHLLRAPLAPLDRPDTIGTDMAALIGWFAAEGWYARNRGSKEKNNIRIEQSLLKNPAHVIEIDGILDRLGGEYSRHIVKGGKHVLWSLSGTLAKAVQAAVPDKVLPWNLVATLSASEMADLLDAFVKGDGNRKGKNDCITITQKRSTNRTNLEVLQAMATLLGKTASIGDSATRDMSWLTMPGEGRIQTTKTAVAHLDRKRLWVQMVWCPTTDNGRWIARRNGCVFVTGNTSRPRFMQNDMGKILTVFRNYSVNLAYRMFRDAHQAFAGATAEERAEARTQLIGISLSMMAHAGIKGAYGYGIIMLLLSMFFPGDSDDIEEWMQDALLMEGDSIGVAAWNYIMGAALNGVPGQILGADLTDRIGAPNIWFRGPSSDLEGVDLFNHYFGELFGPIYGIGSGLFRGAALMNDGEWFSENDYRGLETAAPKFIRDIMKAGRYGMEGVETMGGDDILPDVNPYQLLLQASGFTPAEVSERFDMNSRLKNKEREITDERKDIHKAAAEAIIAGEPIPQDVLEDILDFNRRFPEYPITAKSIKESAQGRVRSHKNADAGLTLNAKIADRLREGLAPSLYN